MNRVFTRAHLIASGAVAVATAGAVAFAPGASAQPVKAAPKTVTCTAANTDIKITKVAQPYNHLLVRARNTSKNNCNAFSAPYLCMGKEAQAPAFVIKESQPQAVVTLFPGETAYASIIVAGYSQREEDYATNQVGVLFANRNNNGSVGSEATVKVSGKGVINAGQAMVTYWQYSRKDALAW